MSRELDIVRVRIYAAAPATTPPYRWTGQDGFVRMTDNILRLTARNGMEGWASNTSNVPERAAPLATTFLPRLRGKVRKGGRARSASVGERNSTASGGTPLPGPRIESGAGSPPQGGRGYVGGIAEPDRTLADRLAEVAPRVLAASALEREAVSDRLLKASDDPRRRAESLVDIALWDLAARAAGEPLWRYLGGAKAEIPAYASTPVFEEVADYVRFVGELAGRGYRAVKLHTRCDPDWDLAMVAAVHAAHGTRIRFMLDVEQRYDLQSAVRVGRRLAALGFVWFEAPLPDPDLDAYAELRRAVAVPVLPAGNTLTALDALRDGVSKGAWSHIRTGPTHAGGIGPAMRAMALASAHGTTVELQSYGYEGRKLAALHLALGLGDCGWFEMPVPEPDFEYELAHPPRPDGEGVMRPPDGPGLGPVPDWERIEAQAFLSFDLA